MMMKIISPIRHESVSATLNGSTLKKKSLNNGTMTWDEGRNNELPKHHEQ